MLQNNNSNNLDLLRILYIVKACFNFLGALFFILYAFLGSFLKTFISSLPKAEHKEPFPDQLLWVFVIIGTIGALICLFVGFFTLIAASKIKARKAYNFIFAAAIINCFTGLLGIGLGVFTFVELSKPHVKALFQPPAERKIGF